MKIGNVELDNNVFLAPMAGITDLPFRLICKKFEPGLVFTEMVSSKALLYGDEKTKLLLETVPKERPLAVQIFGSDLEAVRCAVKYLNDKADIIDINMGCPAPKVTKNGDGSKLLLNLELVRKIVEVAVKNAIVPITVKIRTGWDKEHIVAVEAAKVIEQAGASAITVHGRTRSEFYTGEADWNIIKEVKESVKIPVIGNGDIKSANDALKMLEVTGVDGVMIGRASIGNPWIFKDIIQAITFNKRNISGNDEDNQYKYSSNYKEPIPSYEEKLEIILEHIDLACKYKGENIAIKEMRKHIGYYTKGLKDSSEIRNKINQLQTRKEVEETLKQYFKNI